MRWLRFFRRSRRDADFAREITSYLEIETDENIARGMPPAAARAAAMRKFGNATRVREDEYLMNTISPLDTLWQDLRYAFRLLARDKAFAVAAVLSLTLGIGANTAIFQLIDAIRLRTLPVEDAQSLALIRFPDRSSRMGAFQGRWPILTHAQWQAIDERQQAFSNVIAWNTRRFNVAPGGEVRFVEGMFVSGDYFQELGVQPHLGRLITPADDRRGCGQSGAVISHSLWQRAFGGDAGVLSRTLSIDGVPFPIIGVTPPEFFGTEVGWMYDVALPLCADDLFNPQQSRLDSRHVWWLAAVGRLKPGWTIERATEHLTAISPGVFEATLPASWGTSDADRYRALRLIAFPAGNGLSNVRQNFQEPLNVLLATAALVLMIACANLANLLLARASARGREIVMRLALGASRRRIVRQLLVESGVLAATGAILGAMLAGVLSRLLIQVLAAGNPSVFFDLSWSWRLFGFTAGVAFGACLLFGVAPALRATALSPATALRGTGRGVTAGPERFGLRRGLVVVQVALSLVLLLGALLFGRTLYNLLSTDPGFRSEGLVTALVSHLSRMPAADRRDPHVLRREIRDRIAALPDVAAVAQADVTPLGTSGFWNESVRVDGIAATERKIANFNRVSPGFFAMLGIPLVGGRDFSDADTVQSPPVAVVNEAFVRQLIVDGQALGRTVRILVGRHEPEPAFEIVGIVKDTKVGSLREQMVPLVYLASAQEQDPGNGTQLIVRSRGALAVSMPAIARAIGEMSPNVSVEFRVVAQSIQNSLLRERLMASLSGAFGLLAAILAAIGVYGVMSYTVARRANEIGIRMAMGAARFDVTRMVLSETGWLILGGVGAGTAIALGTARFARSLLFELDPTDPTTVGLAILTLSAIGLLAGYLPARRASRLDPALALRDE